MAPPRNQSPQTRSLLLALLDQPSSWQYGYELSKVTGLLSGTLYPLLIRLNEQGFLESRWEESELPGILPRHVYRMTPNGKRLALTFDKTKRKGAMRLELRGKPA